MEETRFDYLARTVATSGSRRRVLGALLTGALGGLWTRETAADDSGTAIADASGGDHNLAAVVDPAPGGNAGERDHDRDKDRDGDKDKDKDKDSGGAVCPPESAAFCCQCTNDSGDNVGCTARSAITECDSDCGGSQFAQVLEADPGQEYTCVDGNPPTTCTQVPC